MVIALYLNAALLLAIVCVLITRGRGEVVSPAFGDLTQQMPIVGGGGIYVMPCQLHPSVWGCYVIDIDRHTLCTYEYRAGEKALVLTAARNFQYDLQLQNYDTFPAPFDVKKLVEDQNSSEHSETPAVPTTSPDFRSPDSAK
jgi:hypothetical protein